MLPTTTTAATPTAGLSVRMGRQRYPVASIRDAAIKFQDFRDAAEQEGVGGARELPDVFVYEGTRLLGHFSYNGRLWAGRTSKTGDKPLFCPARDAVST